MSTTPTEKQDASANHAQHVGLHGNCRLCTARVSGQAPAVTIKFVTRVANDSYRYIGHLVAKIDPVCSSSDRAVCGFRPKAGWYEPADKTTPSEVTCRYCVERLLPLVG